jgi:DNA repair protein RecN (Recombination protein N)
MLLRLFIKNYALIDEVNANFDSGFTVITGETGAGKSILMDALSLLSGKRADATVIAEGATKSIIEAEFKLNSIEISDFFYDNELDIQETILVRRELSVSGTNRAFINDTPVTLQQLKLLSQFLFDVHAQDDNILLNKKNFQLFVIDRYAQNEHLLNQYQNYFTQYKNALKRRNELQELLEKASIESDYNRFVLNELNSINLDKNYYESNENQLRDLENIDKLAVLFSEILSILNDDALGVLNAIKQLKQKFISLTQLNHKYEELKQRIDSSFIELNDVFLEIENAAEDLSEDPQKKESLNNYIDKIQQLFFKHRVSNIDGLIAVKQDFEKKEVVGNEYQTQLEQLSVEIDILFNKVSETAKNLHQSRLEVLENLQQEILSKLGNLGMKNAQLRFDAFAETDFKETGNFYFDLKFSGNKGRNLQTIDKNASGGEISRLMLAIQSVLSGKSNLPTIVFDEIDTGVSGEIASGMAQLMKEMGKSMQIITITHLPQVAAPALSHFEVIKHINGNKTYSNLMLLNKEQRILAIAKMLSDGEVSDAAIANAKRLLEKN